MLTPEQTKEMIALLVQLRDVAKKLDQEYGHVLNQEDKEVPNSVPEEFRDELKSTMKSLENVLTTD